MKGSLRFLSSFALVSQIGIMMATPVVFCAWLGGIIDNKLGTGALFLIILMFIGVGVAFQNLFMLIKRQEKRNKGVKDE